MKNKERFFWIFLVSFLSYHTLFPLEKAKALSLVAEKYLQIFHEITVLIQTDYVDSTEEKNLFQGAIKGMLASLGDPYTRFMEEEEFKSLQEETRGSFGGVGLEVTQSEGSILVITPIDDTPAMKAGILPQDKILEINGQATDKITFQEAIKLMRGPVGSPVSFKIKRKTLKDPISITLNRELIKIQFVKSTFLDKEKLGYLRLSQFMGKDSTPEEYRKIIKEFQKQGMKGLIIDLRSNPGGLLDLAIDFCNLFLPNGYEILSVKGRGGKLEKVYSASALPEKYLDVPMVVLVNNGSASASEIFAGALQDHKRATIVGVQSFGKGSVQHIYPLSHKTGIALTIQKYFTPSGVSIHKKGITPDVVVAAIAPDDSEKPMIEKLVKENIISNFVKNNPEGYTPKTINVFQEELGKHSIKIRPVLAKFLLKREYGMSQNQPIIDREFDVQLNKAIEILSK
jgi:carboxyl-terminal processing protease